MKSREVTWAGHVVCMEDMITEYEILFGKAEWKNLIVKFVYRDMILKCILKKWGKKNGKMWTGFIWCRLGTCDRLL
jgi:hypothetical protein